MYICVNKTNFMIRMSEIVTILRSKTATISLHNTNIHRFCEFTRLRMHSLQYFATKPLVKVILKFPLRVLLNTLRIFEFQATAVLV